MEAAPSRLPCPEVDRGRAAGVGVERRSAMGEKDGARVSEQTVRCPAKHYKWWCTLPKDHDGDHAVITTHATWTDDQSDDSLWLAAAGRQWAKEVEK